MGQWNQVARRAHGALHVHDGVYIVVEEVYQSLHSLQVYARITIRERLYLEQYHELHYLVGHPLTNAAGMAHHQVDLQL